MRVFACKDRDGMTRVLRSANEPTCPDRFDCSGYCLQLPLGGDEAKQVCSTLTPGTFRELKKLDVVSGEFEFVEVPKLREAWEDYKSVNMRACDHELNDLYAPLWRKLAAAIDRELSKPAPRYDEKLIDEFLEVCRDVTVTFDGMLSYDAANDDWAEPSNIRAAEILQELKRAKGEG